MKQNIDYKVPNGKMIRLEAELDENMVHSIKICGDFFVHPETAITEIEALLAGTHLNEVIEKVNEFIEKKHVKLVGFDATDLANALRKGQNE